MRGQNLMLTIITIAAIGFIFVYYKQYLHSLWMRIALSVLLGGALGNFMDRIRHGEVTDFLRFRLLPDFGGQPLTLQMYLSVSGQQYS